MSLQCHEGDITVITLSTGEARRFDTYGEPAMMLSKEEK
jgi:hypothetical protein